MIDAINQAIDTAIAAIPLAFIAFVITRETVRARSSQSSPKPSATPQPIETTNHPAEPIEVAPAPENEPEIEQPAEPTPSAIEPSPAATVEALIQTARAGALRRYCTQAGITWRNAHGKGKHLSTSEMRRALLATGHSQLPWVA